jgi:hypothetical protein
MLNIKSKTFTHYSEQYFNAKVWICKFTRRKSNDFEQEKFKV